MGLGPQGPGRPGRSPRRLRLGAVRAGPLRRPAPSRRPGPSARRGRRRPLPRRAHQPPGRRGRRVARPPPDAALAPHRRRPRGGHPRPVVPRRGLHAHVGGARRHGGPVRRRLRGVGARARGALPAGGGDGAEASAAREEGARLAAPWRPGAHVQAEVPHRGGQRHHRGRPRPARLGVPGEDGHGPARQGRPRPRAREPDAGGEADPRRRHPAPGARRAARRGRRQRCGQVDPAAPARRPHRSGLGAGEARQDGGLGHPHPGREGARRRRPPARRRSHGPRRLVLPGR